MSNGHMSYSRVLQRETSEMDLSLQCGGTKEWMGPRQVSRWIDADTQALINAASCYASSSSSRGHFINQIKTQEPLTPKYKRCSRPDVTSLIVHLRSSKSTEKVFLFVILYYVSSYARQLGTVVLWWSPQEAKIGLK